MSKNLTKKQEQSCHDFIKTGNKTEAYRRNYSTNGMSESVLNIEAVKHFNIPKISLRVKELQSKVELRNEVTQDKIINELAGIAFYDIRRLFDDNGKLKEANQLTELDGKVISSIKSTTHYGTDDEVRITTEYKLNNKNTSIDQLAKILGYYEKDNEQKKPELPMFNLIVKNK